VPNTINVVSSNHAHSQVYSTQHYVIKFVSDLGQICGFLRFASTNKTDRHDITELLLKVALNTITLTISNEHKTIDERGTIFSLGPEYLIQNNFYLFLEGT